METLLCFIGMSNIALLLIGKIPCKVIFKSSIPLNEFGRQLVVLLPGGAQELVFIQMLARSKLAPPAVSTGAWLREQLTPCRLRVRKPVLEPRAAGPFFQPHIVGDVLQCLWKFSC